MIEIIFNRIKKIFHFAHTFFYDHARTRSLLRRKKKNGAYTYTLISAIKNDEAYLNDFFKSIIGQLLDFRMHLHILLIDCGSTDNSLDIIRTWCEKYPINIHLLKEKSHNRWRAYNIGLSKVQTPWVTFIEPKDFIDIKYFLHIDNLLSPEKNKKEKTNFIKLIACRPVIYNSTQKQFKNTHFLNGYFEENTKIYTFSKISSDSEIGIFPDINGILFRHQEIKKNNIKFTPEVQFYEDTRFVLTYIAGLTEGRICLLRLAKYYLRSGIVRRYGSPSKYSGKELFIEGTKNIFEFVISKSLSPCNRFIQKTALYCLISQIKYLCNKPIPSFFSSAEAEQYLMLLRGFGAHLSPDIIEYFYKYNMLTFAQYIALLYLLKGITPTTQRIYIHRYDYVKNQLCFIYYTTVDCSEQIIINGKESPILFTKNTLNTIVGSFFYWRRQIWITIPQNLDSIHLMINNCEAVLATPKGVWPEAYISRFISARTPSKKNRGASIWLLMDRDVQANDNAEHLYRYIATHHPEQKIFLALRSSSPDWKRLEGTSVNLLDFGTQKYEKILRKCDKIISSHVGHYIMDYFPNLLNQKHFIFLQHGVIRDDISQWLNRKKIDLFITSTHAEYNSIADDRTRYNDSERNVVLTGLPRHDALQPYIEKHDNMILIMPTWRENLVGKFTSKKTCQRMIREGFMDSDYAKYWGELLQDERLRSLSEKYKMKIVFFPHAVMQDYIPQFKLDQHITVLDHNSVMIQDLFKQASVLITDYSSVAFEVAFLKKPIIYYQFDHNTFFSGIHTSSVGYFDYNTDGFGPITFTCDTTVKALENILHKQCQPDEKYKKRMEDTFPFRDGLNCERVYTAILSLDTPSGFQGQGCLVGPSRAELKI